MMKLLLITTFILILLNIFANANEKKRQQAEFRARLAKAKSIQDALIILKTSGKKGPSSYISQDAVRQEHEALLGNARSLARTAQATIEPRNGGCEPRIVCEEVPVDRTSSSNVVSFPQCVEVHRCGGCCQEPQFPCVPIQQRSITFSPLLLVSLDDTDRYEVNRPLTLMNHTQCECKCSKTEEQCHQEGKTLDSTLCQCVEPRCTPECLISSTCSIVPGSNIPRCTCRRRRISGETGNFCSNPTQRPNAMCTRCETVYG